MHEQLPYLRSLGIGALILKGVFDVEVFPLNLTAADKNFAPLAWIQHLLSEPQSRWVKNFFFFANGIQTWFYGPLLLINRLHAGPAGLKIVLDLCKRDLLALQDVTGNLSATTQVKPAFWSCTQSGVHKIWNGYSFYSVHSTSGWKKVWQVLLSVTLMQHIQKR